MKKDQEGRKNKQLKDGSSLARSIGLSTHPTVFTISDSRFL